MEDQREFVEHLQIGKQIGKLLDIPKRPQAPTHMFWGLEYEKSGSQVPNFENMKKMFMRIMCRLGQTLFQTSS